MEFFQDFLAMSAVERNEYVAKYGLAEVQRQELLQLNRVISALLQADAFQRGEMRRELNKLIAATRKVNSSIGI